MKFIDKHIKNVISSILACLVAFYIFKFAGVTIGEEFWLLSILLLLIYTEILDMSDKIK